MATVALCYVYRNNSRLEFWIVEPGPPATYRIESVDKALRLLWLLRAQPHLTVTEASQELGAARSTAHRLLAMLVEHRFADQDPSTRAYHPGPALLEIGLGAIRNVDVREAARPDLERLAAALDETVQLVTLAGARTLVIDAAECSQALRVSGRTGGSLPPNCTSAGKALLAPLPFDRVRALLGPEPLERHTERSIGTYAELERELERVRERGYATNLGENEDGIGAVSALIRVPRGVRPAAITVTAPIARMIDERIPVVAAAAREAAERVTARLT
jgi:IclR family transcriptional regulator, acetate operon repressor